MYNSVKHNIISNSTIKIPYCIVNNLKFNKYWEVLL